MKVTLNLFAVERDHFNNGINNGNGYQSVKGKVPNDVQGNNHGNEYPSADSGVELSNHETRQL